MGCSKRQKVCDDTVVKSITFINMNGYDHFECVCEFIKQMGQEQTYLSVPLNEKFAFNRRTECASKCFHPEVL